MNSVCIRNLYQLADKVHMGQVQFRLSSMSLGVIFSIIVHALIFALIVTNHQSTQHHTQAKPQAMQIETMGEKDYLQKLKERYKKKERQIVQMDERLKSDSKPDTTAEKVFLSKHNSHADRNMRAARVGQFKNVLNEGSTASKSVEKLFELPKDLIKAQDELNISKNIKNAPTGKLFSPATRSPASIRNEGDGYSATDDHIKDVVVGAQTILNTEEYKFYSFYARIRQALSSQWTYRVKQELMQIYASGESLGENEKITKVEIRLDSKGELMSAHVVNSSGVYELDRAASDAFKAAAPFPHPPKDMIDENNEVAIKWDFVVYANPSTGVRVQINQGGF